MHGYGGGGDPRLAAARAEQVRLLQEHNPVARRARDVPGEAWDVGLKLASGKIIRLRTTLPDHFPGAPPMLHIIEPCVHTWLDGSGRVVGHRELNSWNHTMNVGRILQEVVAEFSTRPPMPRDGPPAPVPGYPGGGMPPRGGYPAAPAPGHPAPGGFYPGPGRGPMPGPVAGRGAPTSMYGSAGAPRATHPGGFGAPSGPPSYSAATGSGAGAGRGGGGSGSGSGGGGGGGGEHTPMPAIPSRFAALDAKTEAELQLMNHDDATLSMFMRDLEQVKTFVGLLETTRRGNLEKARANAAQEAKVQELKSSLRSLQDGVSASQQRLDEALAHQREALSRFSVDTLARRLETEADDLYTLSDDMARDFHSGRGEFSSVKDFVPRFIEARQRYHMKKAKAELLRRNGLGAA